MTEITRVALQPLAKGSISKVWLGVIALGLAGAALATAGNPPLVRVDTVLKGTGASPTLEDVVLIDYQGQLPNGTVFDQQNHAVMPLQGVVPGFAKALLQMQKGGKYHVVIPAKLGYGSRAVGPIPANTDLTFNITLIDFRNRAEIEQQQRMMQQMQAQAGHGAPAGQ